MPTSTLEKIGNTPLVSLDSFPLENGCRLWAKLEFMNPSGSIKDRIVCHIVADAERRGLLRPGGTIVESTSGNTGAAIAMIAAHKGYRTILTMPDKVSVEKQTVLRAMGAELIVCPTEAPLDSPDHYVQRAQEIHTTLPGSFILNQYDNPLNAEAHYLTTGPEIWRQTDGQIDLFVASGSTGGTISGVGRYLKEKNPNIKVVLLDPVGSIYHSYFYKRTIDTRLIAPYMVEGVGEDHLAGCMDLSIIDDVLQFTDDDAFDTARLIARQQGLLCGGSAGANVWGALTLSRSYTGASIVTVLPDSGLKYISKIFSGNSKSRKLGSNSDAPANRIKIDTTILNRQLAAPSGAGALAEHKMAFDTLLLHSPFDKGNWRGSTLVPIFQSAAFAHDSAESLSAAFTGQTGDPIYTRLSNPTTSALEARLAALEGGVDALATASGMAAVANTCMALVSAGDEFVAIGTVFLSTYNLFSRLMNRIGVRCRFVDARNYGEIEKVMSNKVRFLYVESLQIPAMKIVDVKALASVAHQWSIPLIVDNTSLSPHLFNPIRLGADILIHSTTKFIAGHGSAIGGVIIDAGTFDVDDNSRLFPAERELLHFKNKSPLITKIWREQTILQGATPSPTNSFLTMVGLQTLSLRVQRASANAAIVARYLAEQAEVRWVRYPSLQSKSEDTFDTGVASTGGAIVAFTLADETACFKFIRNLNMILNLANLGDCKTLIIHPYSSQYATMSEEEKLHQGIDPGYLRLSVGIEEPGDILADLGRGFAALTS